MTPFAASSFNTSPFSHSSFSTTDALHPLTMKSRTLSSSNAQENGWFGVSVSTSEEFVAVGAYSETADGYTAAGRAYVFNATSGALIETLTSPNAQSYGEFGSSVSISGTLVTRGAPNEIADGYYHAGHAYIFYNV